MKLIVTIPANSLAVDFQDAAVIAALSKCVPVSSEGWGSEKQWKPTKESRIEMEIIQDEQFGEKDEVRATLAKEKADADKRWLDQYSQAQAFKKERDELKKQLDDIKAKVS